MLKFLLFERRKWEWLYIDAIDILLYRKERSFTESLCCWVYRTYF